MLLLCYYRFAIDVVAYDKMNKILSIKQHNNSEANAVSGVKASQHNAQQMATYGWGHLRRAVSYFRPSWFSFIVETRTSESIRLRWLLL